MEAVLAFSAAVEFADYELQTERTIPVVVLERVD
jgi:hypothetical protein